MTSSKLHLGCGPVYFRGYVNVDIKGLPAKDHPEIVKENLTTRDKYFKHPYVYRPLGHNKRGKIVVDVKSDVTDLRWIKDKSVSEILMVNVINHLHYKNFVAGMKEWSRVLKRGGRLIIDVDDVIGNCQQVVKANKTGNSVEFEKAMRYLFCHGRDRYDSHFWGYTPWYLCRIATNFGFEFVERNDEYIYHDTTYPRFLIILEKV